MIERNSELYKDIIIVGAGGLGREVLWLLEELNQYKRTWSIKGFVDDNEDLLDKEVNGYPVLGNIEWLSHYPDSISAVCCIAKPEFRVMAIEKLKKNKKIELPNIIAQGVRYSDRVTLGEGNVICLATTLTVDINIGNFNIINPACTIGHDVKLDDYITIYPGVNVSGNVHIGNNVEVGTGTQIIQGLNICDGTVIGAGSVVIRSIDEKGTYVGVPARRVK